MARLREVRWVFEKIQQYPEGTAPDTLRIVLAMNQETVRDALFTLIFRLCVVRAEGGLVFADAGIDMFGNRGALNTMELAATGGYSGSEDQD